MQISIPINRINSYNTIIKSKKDFKISFGQNNSDIFVKTRKVRSPEELSKILNGDTKNLDKNFFDELSNEEYKYCLDWAKSDEKKFGGMVQYRANSVLPEDVRGIVKYGDFYYSGLQKIAKKANKDMTQVLLIGIGQSPVAAIKLLELIGVKIAFCPISGLTTFNEPVEKYVTPKNVEKYFSYWKNFGFNIDDLFGDKLIVFTDHKETGKTLEVFKEIIDKIIKIKKPEMEKLGKKPAKIKFLSLRDIYKSAKKESIDRKWGNDFEDSVFHTSYLKTLYSPLFKLPLPNISEIEKLHELAKGSDRSIRFNKLTVLMYDELYRKKSINNNIINRMLSSLNHERQFRLAFYIPDLF